MARLVRLIRTHIITISFILWIFLTAVLIYYRLLKAKELKMQKSYKFNENREIEVFYVRKGFLLLTFEKDDDAGAEFGSDISSKMVSVNCKYSTLNYDRNCKDLAHLTFMYEQNKVISCHISEDYKKNWKAISIIMQRSLYGDIYEIQEAVYKQYRDLGLKIDPMDNSDGKQVWCTTYDKIQKMYEGIHPIKSFNFSPFFDNGYVINMVPLLNVKKNGTFDEFLNSSGLSIFGIRKQFTIRGPPVFIDS